MQTHKTIAGLQKAIKESRSKGLSVGLVPTMGNLHAGHLKLVREAKRQCDWVVCSVFVNPLQFGVNEDLESYPRTLDADRTRLEECRCDCLFHPVPEEIYPRGLAAQTVVSVPGLADSFCGKSRPGHFDGVTTVVCKLFNICQPDRAFFGLKDYQQYLIICRMVEDLQIPVQIIGVETEREPDGLALSSRNTYLTDEQRNRAPLLFQCLSDIANQLLKGNRNFRQLEQNAIRNLLAEGFEADYLSICNSANLSPPSERDRELIILAAARLGRTRLIDNLRLTLPEISATGNQG